MIYKSPLEEMSKTTPTQFWNDSCSLPALEFAISHGATGATTNPVIISQVLEAELDKHIPIIRELDVLNPHATEDDIAWLLNEKMVTDAARLLLPIYRKTAGKAGSITIQTNAKYHRDAERITEQAVHFSTLAENILVKMPVTLAGLEAIEESTYRGVNVAGTVCFSVSQAIEVAEAVERGMDRRAAENLDNTLLNPVCAVMIGRVDDWLWEVAESNNIIVDPQAITMSGVAVIKNAYRIFKECGYRTRLLAAAYRHHHHWSELIGGDLSMTIPPMWIRRFIDSDITVENRMDTPVAPELLAQLQKHFPDFNRAYEPDGMKPYEFDSYGATNRTLTQFLDGYTKTVGIVRGVITK